MPLHVEVLKHESNAENGTVTYHLRVVETDDDGRKIGEGPIEHHGLPPDTLEKMSQGGAGPAVYEQFVAQQGKTMLGRYKACRHHAEHAKKLQGKMIRLD